MKNVLKKITASLMAITLVMPLASVKAISGNYYEYGKGDEVNFYYNEDDYKKGEAGSTDAGMSTIVLSDEGKNSQYVKTLAIGFVKNGMTVTEATPISYSATGFTYSKDDTLSPVAALISNLNSFPVTTPYVKGLDENVGLISLDELIDVFGAKKQDDGTYTIDLDASMGSDGNSVRKVLEPLTDAINVLVVSNDSLKAAGSTSINGSGFYTSTLSEDKTKVYAVVFEYDGEEVKSATVKLVDIPSEYGSTSTSTTSTTASTTTEYETVYALVPTLYFDKTYDCHEHVSYSCYVCNDEYVWSEDGKQASSCKVAENISDKAKCVKPVETGVSEYVAEFVGVASLCGIALILIKRKDLFKSI